MGRVAAAESTRVAVVNPRICTVPISWLLRDINKRCLGAVIRGSLSRSGTCIGRCGGILVAAATATWGVISTGGDLFGVERNRGGELALHGGELGGQGGDGGR